MAAGEREARVLRVCSALVAGAWMEGQRASGVTVHVGVKDACCRRKAKRSRVSDGGPPAMGLVRAAFLFKGS